MANCSVCGSSIHPDRLEVLPNTTLCVSCASTRVVADVVYMDYSHKTAPQLVRVRGDDREALRLARRAFRRAR